MAEEFSYTTFYREQQVAQKVAKIQCDKSKK